MKISHAIRSSALGLRRRSAALRAAGLQAQQQAPPEVTFQVEVNYVDVDAIVTDEKGNFITGLTRDDFEVFEDGKPQKVEMFSYVELPVERDGIVQQRSIVLSRAMRARTGGHSTDACTSSCSTTSISARFADGARQARRRASSSSATSARTISPLSSIPAAAPEATQDFTNDRSLLVAAIDKFSGRRLRSAAIEALERHYHNELTAMNRPENYVHAGAGIKDSAKPIDIRDVEREQRALAWCSTR